MQNNTLLKSLVVSAALSLGLTGFAQAQPAEAAPSLTSDGQGLLGQNYASLTYSYVNFDGISAHGDTYSLSFNTPLRAGLDGLLGYDYSQSGEILGSRYKEHALGAGLRAFSNSFDWAKPYVEAGAGFVWQKYGSFEDDSFFWQVSAGAEFQLAAALTLTPYVQYLDAPDISDDGVVNFGAKANYWVNSEWAVTVGLSRDDDKNMTYTLGTNFRF